MRIGASTFTVPKSMTDTESFVDYADSGEPILVEVKGTYILDAKASAASISANESVDDAATRIKQGYLDRGYADGDQ